MKIQPRRKVFDCDAAVVIAYTPMGKATKAKLQLIPVPGTGVPKGIDLLLEGDKALLSLRAAIDYALNEMQLPQAEGGTPEKVRFVVDPPALRTALAERFPVNG